MGRYKGVHWHSTVGRWAVVVWTEGRPVLVARVDDEEAAAVLYDRAAMALFGAEAERNFPRRSVEPASVAELRRELRLEKKATAASSKYIGVTRVRSEIWIAQINHDGEHHALGAYRIEEEAAIAFDRASLHLRGEDAPRNFPGRRFDPAHPAILRSAAKPAMAAALAETKTSKYKGVSRQANGTYAADVRHEGTRHRLGSFSTAKEAARARDRAVLWLRGAADETLNFPREIARGEIEPAPPAQIRKDNDVRSRGAATSRYRGVCWTEHTRRWLAYAVMPDGSPTKFGYYDDEEAAAVAYDRGAVSLFGKDAPLNFPRRATRAATPDALRRAAHALVKEKKSSRYRGVSWVRRGGYWLVSIMVDRKSYKVGTFDDEIQAACAYDAAALRLRGPTAWLNFPTEP